MKHNVKLISKITVELYNCGLKNDKSRALEIMKTAREKHGFSEKELGSIIDSIANIEK